ncbi:hypothetical protein Ddye_031396 [Dipteronia dyeriana]|uniref:Uncharacterized protein n=1 Tax=Dipteronia dyeriana TaxID=168575 RepID=A0AAD9TJ65_9ROSI|nr:hypothetical protein Ddye_031396 [Dipteronia dyeriana]
MNKSILNEYCEKIPQVPWHDLVSYNKIFFILSLLSLFSGSQFQENTENSQKAYNYQVTVLTISCTADEASSLKMKILSAIELVVMITAAVKLHNLCIQGNRYICN